MDTLEKNLATLLAADAPPARDGAFTVGVMARIERQRFRNEIVSSAAVASLAGVALFTLAPQLTGLMQGVSGNLVAALAVTFAVLGAMQWSLREMEI